MNRGAHMIGKRSWLAVAAVVVSAAVWAGDGIPIGNAVFYPSVEAVYTHTDNLFLQDSSMPNGNVSDSFWEIRPMLGIEFPFKESSIRLDFGYQYKDYRTYQLSSHNTYYGDFKGNFKFANGMALDLENHYIRGVQEVLEFDPGYEQYFSNSPFDRDAVQAGLTMPVTALNTLTVYGTYNYVHFTGDNRQQQPFYDYDQSAGGLTWKYHYSPVSDFLVDAEYLSSRPTNTAQDVYLYINPNRKYDQQTYLVGWEGAFGKELTGFAKAGYSKMNFKDNPFSGFSGFVSEVGLGLQTSQHTHFDLKLSREPYQSVYNVNNYYTATGGTLQVQQQVSKIFFWTLGYYYQENRYPDAVVANPAVLGLFPPLEFQLTQGMVRRDDIGRAFAEIGLHPTKQLSLRFNYQHENRHSNINYWDTQLRKPYSYAENLFSFQVQLGW